MASDAYQNRINALRSHLAGSAFDLIALTAGPSQVYFSGLHFHISERPAVLLVGSDKPPAFIFPAFEAGKVDTGSIPLEKFAFTEQRTDWERAFRDAVSHFGGGKVHIGVEPTAMRFLEMDLLVDGEGTVSFASAQDMLEKLRAQKDSSEVEAIRAAVQVAEQALVKTLQIVKIGMTEKEIANELVLHLLKEGSEPEMPFFPIVASGPNSANPHAGPSERRLEIGDLLLFDWGARVNGYISDITRTFAIGSISAQLAEIYEVVRSANAAARAYTSEQIIAADIDRKARDVITAAGYGEEFFHRTGHGYGMEAHEAPYIASDNTQQILPGMTFTIEPGVYLPGVGGVRIEDDMHALDGKLETLTTFERELTIL